MTEVTRRVSAAQLTDRGQQGDGETAMSRPRLSLDQIFGGTGKEIVEVPIELVHRDESQAREDFDKGAAARREPGRPLRHRLGRAALARGTARRARHGSSAHQP